MNKSIQRSSDRMTPSAMEELERINAKKTAKFDMFLRRYSPHHLNETHVHLIDDLYNIYVNGRYNITHSDVLMNAIGNYYHSVSDYNQMKTFYMMAIERGNTDAMVNLGRYYQDINDYEEMKRFYDMAISKGNPEAMINLGRYYQDHKKNDKMLEYYQMADARGLKPSDFAEREYIGPDRLEGLFPISFGVIVFGSLFVSCIYNLTKFFIGLLK
jgi:TPR repeat protein